MKRAQLKEISQVDAFKPIEKKGNRFYVCKSRRKFIIKIMLFLKGMIKWLHMLLWLCTTSLEPSLIYPHGHICPEFHSTWQWHMDLITGKMIRNDRRLRLDLVLKKLLQEDPSKNMTPVRMFYFLMTWENKVRPWQIHFLEKGETAKWVKQLHKDFPFVRWPKQADKAE